MIHRKRLIIILFALGIFFLGGCKENQSPIQLVDGGSGDSAQDSSSGSSPGDDMGSALISYQYIVNTPPSAVIVISPDIEVTFDRDPNNEGKWLVNGFTHLI